jgi:hypothetical protein
MNTTATALPTHFLTIKRASAAAIALLVVVVAVVALSLATRGHSSAGRPSDARSVPSEVHVPHRPGTRW